jgi:hypothetical protein
VVPGSCGTFAIAAPCDDGAWTQKRFLSWLGVIFALVALFHLVRIFMEWTVIIGDWSIPMWASWIALVVAGGLALLGLRLGERRQGDG